MNQRIIGGMLLTALAQPPREGAKPRLNPNLSKEDVAETIAMAVESLMDHPAGAVGTHFSIADLPTAAIDALGGPDAARDWLTDQGRSRRIIDAMTEAGNRAIAELLWLHGLPTDDDDDDDDAQGPEGNGVLQA